MEQELNECPICFESLYPIVECCDTCNYVWCYKCSNKGIFEVCPFCRAELDEYVIVRQKNETDIIENTDNTSSICKKIWSSIKSKLRYIFVL